MEALLDRDDWYELRLPPERLEPKSFADLLKLEDIAVELIADYAGRFWRRRRRRWEYENLEVRTLDEGDRNNIGEYALSVDAGQETLIDDIRAVSNNLREGAIPGLGFGLLMRDEHAYKPLLYAAGKRVVTVQPVLLNEDEKQVVERLTDLAKSGDSCLQGRDLFLIRNMSRGRGVSLFDDHSYYPDFIVWLADGEDQHILFLDPKGLVRYGPEERRKVGLHSDIKQVEERVRRSDPNLRLHAYVLSVTAAGQDRRRPAQPGRVGRAGRVFPRGRQLGAAPSGPRPRNLGLISTPPGLSRAAHRTIGPGHGRVRCHRGRRGPCGVRGGGGGGAAGGRALCSSRTSSKPSAPCPATRPSAGSAKAIWCARSTRSTASWAAPSTGRASSSGC